MFVMSALFGRAISQSAAISPGAFVPISITATSDSAEIASKLNGTPISLLKLSGFLVTWNLAPSTAAMSSLTVVFPQLPVTPMTGMFNENLCQ